MWSKLDLKSPGPPCENTGQNGEFEVGKLGLIDLSCIANLGEAKGKLLDIELYSSIFGVKLFKNNGKGWSGNSLHFFDSGTCSGLVAVGTATQPSSDANAQLRKSNSRQKK